MGAGDYSSKALYAPLSSFSFNPSYPTDFLSNSPYRAAQELRRVKYTPFSETLGLPTYIDNPPNQDTAPQPYQLTLLDVGQRSQ